MKHHITAYYISNGRKSARIECSYITTNLEKLREKLKQKHENHQIFFERKEIT